MKLLHIIYFVLHFSFLATSETVHFTNSLPKVLTSNNYTTYQVEVPGGADPITIIEANSPSYDFNEYNKKYSINQHKIHQHKNQDETDVDFKNSLSMTANNEESVTNYDNDPQYSTMKTVYSPELLQKFLKDYASKLSTAKLNYAGNLSQDKLNEIIKLKNQIQDQIEVNQAIEQDDENSSQNESEILKNEENRRHTNRLTHTGGTSGVNTISERKNYNMPNKFYGSNNNNNQYPNKHPYNQKNGWVSLEPIPWSTSKISKWHSSANKYNQNGNSYDRPSRPYGNRPSGSGGGYYIEDEDDIVTDDDDYYHQSHYQNRPSHSSPSHTSGHNNYYQNSQATIQTAHGIVSPGNNHHHSYGGSSLNRPRPWQPEIITDDTSPDFPRPSRPLRPDSSDYQFTGGIRQKIHSGGNHRVPSTYPNR